MFVGARVFHSLLSYWDFHAQPFLWFTKNGVKKEKKSTQLYLFFLIYEFAVITNLFYALLLWSIDLCEKNIFNF